MHRALLRHPYAVSKTLSGYNYPHLYSFTLYECTTPFKRTSYGFQLVFFFPKGPMRQSIAGEILKELAPLIFAKIHITARPVAVPLFPGMGLGPINF